MQEKKKQKDSSEHANLKLIHKNHPNVRRFFSDSFESQRRASVMESTWEPLSLAFYRIF